MNAQFRLHAFTFTVTLSFLTLSSCADKKDSDGKSITTVRVRPPVQEDLPEILLSSGTFTLTTGEVDYSKTCQTDASAGDPCLELETSARLRCIVKNRLFCAGPTEVLNLLDGLDGRLKEIETRSSGMDVTCINEEPTDLSDQLDFPGDAAVAGNFKCQDSAIGLGFGEVDDTWYVREANGAVGQQFVVAPDSSVHGFLWLASKDGTLSSSTGILELLSNRESKTVELTGGGIGFGFCGMHYKSNSEFIYLSMNPDGVGASCDFDQNSTTDSSDWAEACYDAATLEDATADKCTDLKEFELTTLARDVTTGTGTITSFDAAASTADNDVVKVELNSYLNELFERAGTFTGVSEFKAAQ